MAPHSSTLAWRIPWMEEPGGLQSMGSLRVKHNWVTTFTFHFHALEKEMATHSSVLAWRIPGTGEPGGLPSMGLHRLRHDWSNLAAAAADYSMPGFLSFISSQSLLSHVHLVSDAIKPSHSLLPRSPKSLQSFPASGPFPVSWLFASGGQSVGASASAPVLPMNIPGWFPLGLTGLISLQFKGLSRVYSSRIQKHQFFDSQPSLQSNSHIHTWLLEKPKLWLDGPLLAK